MRSTILGCLLVVLVALLAAPVATADPTANPPAQSSVNGADKAAIFATYARVERDTYAYSAPGGEPVQFLDGNQSWWVSIKDRQVVGGVTWYRTVTGRWVRANDIRKPYDARAVGNRHLLSGGSPLDDVLYAAVWSARRVLA